MERSVAPTKRKMKKKRILYVEQAHVGTTGGSHVSLLELIKALDSRKYESTVIFYEENHLLQEFEEVADRVMIYKRPRMLDIGSAFPLSRSPWMTPLFWVLKGFQKGYNFIASLRPFLDFVGFLRREKIDLVHLNNAFHVGFDWLIASKVCRVKCITHQRGLDAVPRTGRFYIRLYDGIICVSEHIREGLRIHGLQVDQRSCVIYNGLDIGAFTTRIKKDPLVVRRELGFEDYEPLIGVVGNIKPWKGQKVVIDAVLLLKRDYGKLRCLLIGSPVEGLRYFRSLKTAVVEEKLEENVFFVGFRTDVPDLINGLDILIHSSIEPEPFGRVIMEGMSLGKPVIATNIGGPAEIVEDNMSGLLVRPGDPEAMAQKIDYLLRHKRVRERLGKAAARRVQEKFDIKLVVGQVEEIYRCLLVNGMDRVCLKK